MRLELISSFVSVADHLSFSTAAKELNVTPSTLSRQVRELESSLGIQLLARTTRRVALTELGQQFYGRCRTGLSEIDRAEQVVTKLGDVPQGLLRVSAPVTFGQAYIAPILAGYLEKYPKVDIELNLNDGHVDFFADRIDVAFEVGDFTNKQKGVEPIAPIERILVASPEYLNNYGMPETPSDLEYHLCLIHKIISPNSTWTFYKAGNKEVMKVDGKVYSNNFIPLREAAIGGKGVALLATITVIEDLKNRNLIQVLRNWQVAPANVFATYPPFDYIPPKSSTFVEYIRNNFLQLNIDESV